MAFNDEAKFEEALITALTQKGWEREIIEYPTEIDLLRNWADIIFANNNMVDRLNGEPLTEGEMAQLLEQIRELRTPQRLNGFINDFATPAIFIGLIGAFIARAIIGAGKPETFGDGAGVLSIITLVVAVVVSIALEILAKKLKLTWLEPFVMPIGMIIAMIAAIPVLFIFFDHLNPLILISLLYRDSLLLHYKFMLNFHKIHKFTCPKVLNHGNQTNRSYQDRVS